MKFIEKAIEKSPFVGAVLNKANETLFHMKELAMALKKLAYLVQRHDEEIQDLYALHGRLIATISDNSVDTQLPSTKDEKEKPN